MTDLCELRARLEVLEAGDEVRQAAFLTTRGDARIALLLAQQNAGLMTKLRATQLGHGDALARLSTEIAGVRDEVREIKVGLAEVLRRLPA